MSINTNASAQESTPPLPSIEPALLGQLLSKLGVTFDADALLGHCQQVTEQLPDVRPVEWVQSVLLAAKLKEAKALQVMWRRLDLRLLPALVLYDGHCWLVDRASDSDQMCLVDVQGIERTVLESDLQDATVVVCKVVNQQKKAGVNPKKSLAAALVWREMFADSSWVIKVVIATVLVNVLAVGTSMFALQVYDRVVPTQSYATLTTLVVGMGIIVLLDWFLKTIRARILDSMACAVDQRTSQYLFNHLVHLQLDVQPRSLGTLAAQVNGLDSVRQFLSSALVLAMVDLPFAFMFIAFIWVIGGQIALVYLLLLPVAVILGWITQRRLKHLMREQMMRQNERQGILVDAIRGAESIRAVNAGWRFTEEWKDITHSIDRYSVQQKAISNFSSVTTGSLSTVAYVGALVVGVFLIGAGELTMGALIASSILGGRVIAPIAQAAQQLAQWQNATQALEMANAVLMLEKERRDDQVLLTPDDIPDSISLDGVRFAYPESPIQQVNVPKLSFQSGDRVLVLGPIGCGKSTLLKVLAGLYRPTEGRVKLGLADLWEMEPQSVASHLSYLPQSVHLFKGTLRSNLALSGTSTDSRLLKVTHDLGIDAIAATSPMGMELPISEGGVGLSGGQQQLVALARVIINQPRVWVLDEPTASLDAESEARVWQVLKENVRPDDILIVATHKPRVALEWVNRVVLMHEGAVLKDGKPENILPQMHNAVRSAGLSQSATGIPPGRRFPDVI